MADGTGRTVLSAGALAVTVPVRHGWLDIVRGVDLELRTGETHVLVGESGSGKSMTARAMLGLAPPGARLRGAVQFDGVELLALAPAALRQIRGRAIGWIPQDPSTALDPLRRIEPQIREVIRVHERPVSRQAARSRARELLGMVGFDNPGLIARSFPHELSGGMLQRAAIAVAIACQPKVVIADEPTTALDVTLQTQILDLLAALRREIGMAVLLVTHDIGVAREVGDRVSVMYAGELVESGPARMVLDEPRHPYLRALLASEPDMVTPRGELRALPGQPPEFDALPAGCTFSPRCEHVHDRCQHAPVLAPVSSDRAVACHLVTPAPYSADEPARREA